MVANHKTMSVIHYIDPQCRSSKPASQALCLIECMMTFWTPWWPWFWLVSVQWLNGARCVGRRGNYKTPPLRLVILLQALSAGLAGVHHHSWLHFFAPLFTGHCTNIHFCWTFSKTQHAGSHVLVLGKALTNLKRLCFVFYPLLTLFRYSVSMWTSPLLGCWVMRDMWPGCSAYIRQHSAKSLKQRWPSEWQLKRDVREPKWDQKDHQLSPAQSANLSKSKANKW